MIFISTEEIAFLLIFSFVGITVGGYGSYVAWRHTTLYQKWLQTVGSFYEGWPMGVQRYWQSRFAFWLFRIIFAVALLAGTSALLAVITHFMT